MEYKLDRTQFQMLTLREADLAFNDHTDMSYQERFKLMRYLNSIAYGYAGSMEPRMDRTVFQARKLNDG